MDKRQFILTTIVFFACFSQIISASVVIEGVDSSYANKEIILYKSADPITETDYELARVKVASNGTFSMLLNIDQTQLVYSYMGIYKIFLFVEPGMKYSIVLPPFKGKTEADLLNPYFTPVEVQLGTMTFKEDDLNILIRMFNDAFVPYYNKHVQKIFSDIDFKQLDEDIERMEKPFSHSKNEYFNDYRRYKYGKLRFIALQNKSKKTSDDFFKNQGFLYNNPAFIDLFNLVYKGYFVHFSRIDSSGMFRSAISDKKSLSLLKKALSDNKVIEPEPLLNMVILKNLYDEFYDDNFSRSAMLQILDTFLVTVKDPQQHIVAQNIYNKVTRLLRGFEPPSFKLYTIDSTLVSLDMFKGKYVYLNFCSCFSYTCMNDFVMLKNLYEKHNQYLEIVTIIVDDDLSVMKDYVKRSGFKWTFLHYGNQPDVLKLYDIRAFPTYYLIDNQGKLSMSPSPAPSEDFEGRLFKEFKARGISVTQNQY